MTIDPKEAASALSDIEQVAYRVRQSTIYAIASWMLILWGGLIVAGNIACEFWPRSGGTIRIAVNVLGCAASFIVGAIVCRRMKVRQFDLRVVGAIGLFFAFGLLWSTVFGHFTPRQLGAFWPTYFMMVYTLAGLWIGSAFVAIGLGVTVLTVIGYFFSGEAFNLWMAVANGGGLLLGGLWMRRN